MILFSKFLFMTFCQNDDSGRGEWFVSGRRADEPQKMQPFRPGVFLFASLFAALLANIGKVCGFEIHIILISLYCCLFDGGGRSAWRRQIAPPLRRVGAFE